MRSSSSHLRSPAIDGSWRRQPVLGQPGALFTDLYELTMAQAYWAEKMSGTAVFEVFFRRLPPGRRYVVAAGLLDVLQFLETFRFEGHEVDYLRNLRLFGEEFLEWLSEVRFTGDVWAVPEGTAVFPGEPIVQVIAPIREAQLVETFILNQIHLQSMMASKAARIVEAARGRLVVDFGARRAHGVDAALKIARTSYLAGAAGTSNLLAAQAYGIRAFGTMAHSFVQAFDDESDAFRSFARLYPGTTLLVDTYDTLRGVERVVDLAARLGDDFRVEAVRLDSGNLERLSKATRARLDAAGLRHVRIFASSDLDENQIAALLASESPIDGFGVGTRLAVVEDAPALDMAYKLVEYEGKGRTKLSSHKTIYPGAKQVFRETSGDHFQGDTIGGMEERLPGQALLARVMEAGHPLYGPELTLAAARRRARQQLDALPFEVRDLAGEGGRPYPVQVSPKLVAQFDRLGAQLRSRRSAL